MCLTTICPTSHLSSRFDSRGSITTDTCACSVHWWTTSQRATLPSRRDDGGAGRQKPRMWSHLLQTLREKLCISHGQGTSDGSSRFVLQSGGCAVHGETWDSEVGHRSGGIIGVSLSRLKRIALTRMARKPASTGRG